MQVSATSNDKTAIAKRTVLLHKIKVKMIYNENTEKLKPIENAEEAHITHL